MDLSIIIPCYNLEPYLDHLFYTLEWQTFNYQVELIFICDSCTDNTCSKISQWCTSQNKYQYQIKEVQAGSAGLARNEGLDIATGTYIWFVDGDDWLIRPDAIQSLLEAAYYFNSLCLTFKYSTNYFHIDNYLYVVWRHLLHKDLIGDLRFRKEQPSEDVAFMRNIFDRFSDNRFHNIDFPFYFYNYNRPGSIMTTYKQNKQNQT